MLLNEARHRRADTVRRRARLAGSLISSPADLSLTVRMAAWRFLLPILKRRLPLPRLVGIMWKGNGRKSSEPEHEERIAELATVVFRSQHAERFGNCLDRSLVLYRYLSAAGSEPELLIGVRKTGRDIEGHAWVTVRGEPIEESSELVEGLARVHSFHGEVRQGSR